MTKLFGYRYARASENMIMMTLISAAREARCSILPMRRRSRLLTFAHYNIEIENAAEAHIRAHEMRRSFTRSFLICLKINNNDDGMSALSCGIARAIRCLLASRMT